MKERLGDVLSGTVLKTRREISPTWYELSNVLYDIGSDGRRMLEPKAETRKRLNGRSPDRFDAMMMSYASPGQAGARQS
jgi:hypothetical protein